MSAVCDICHFANLLLGQSKCGKFRNNKKRLVWLSIALKVQYFNIKRARLQIFCLPPRHYFNERSLDRETCLRFNAKTPDCKVFVKGSSHSSGSCKMVSWSWNCTWCCTMYTGTVRIKYTLFYPINPRKTVGGPPPPPPLTYFFWHENGLLDFLQWYQI